MPLTTDEMLAELKAGPASAVLNVEELYNLGLARGLNGGLAKVAIEERAQLERRQTHVRDLRLVLPDEKRLGSARTEGPEER